MRNPFVLVIALLAVTGCGPPLVHARLDVAEAPSPREDAAVARLKNPRCPVTYGALFPGVGAICQRRDAEGIALVTVGVADLGATIAAFAAEQPTAKKVSVIMLQDVWVYGMLDPILELQRAYRARYVPQDTLGELAIAPFNARVLSHPEVSVGVLVAVALGFGVSALINHPGPIEPAAQPVVLGQPAHRGLAYPLAGAIFATQFTQVSIAEETLFRGFLQSTLAQTCGQTCGWAVGGYLFGGFHALNVLSIDDPKERGRYLALAVPYLVGIGQYFGGVYRMNRYSLATTVAMHFWYDFLLSAADFVWDPRHSSISAKVGLPF